MPLYQRLGEDGTGAGRRLPSHDQGSSEESLYVLYYHVSAFSPVITMSVDSSRRSQRTLAYPIQQI